MTAVSEKAEAIFREALADCTIEQAFERKVKPAADNGHQLLPLGDEDAVDLGHLKRIRIVAAGKASAAMLQALLPRLHLLPSCDLSGVLIAGKQPPNLPRGFQFFQGGHPLPNEASFAGARAVLTMLHDLQQERANEQDTLCLFLISGGASAMMELPLDPSISLADTASFHRELVHSSATIAEINCIRKHFSAVKGGRLAMAADGIPSLSLLVSDVPPGHLDALASGPTLPDTSTIAQCRDILARYNLLGRFAPSVQNFFASLDLPESPKPGDLVTRAFTLLAPDDLAEAARKQAESLGFHAIIDNTCDDWNYRDAAEYLVNRLRNLRLAYPRICLISSGEVIVELPANNSGVGGRNQHFALYAATLLDPSDKSIAILSAGSDGIDGNSQTAGAVVDEHLLREAPTPEHVAGSQTPLHRADLCADAKRSLDHFDSSTFLERLGATIVTGPTGNNLRDLRILLAE